MTYSKILILLILTAFGKSSFGQSEMKYSVLPKIAESIDSCLKLNFRIEENSPVSVGGMDTSNRKIYYDTISENGRMQFMIYQNGQRLFNNEKIKKGIPINCRAASRNDTIFVEGSVGIAGGFGFYLKISKTNYQSYYFPFSDSKIYKLKSNDTENSYSIDVPSKSSTLQLAVPANSNKGQLVKGVLEFTSEIFIENANGKSNVYYAEMKVYFACYIENDATKGK